MTEDTIELLGLRISVYTRIVRIVLAEKGIDYELTEVDIFADGGPPASYLAQHPFGMIPCLLHGDFRVYETAAITRYLDQAFGVPALHPAITRQTARMNQIIGILDSYAYRAMVWDVYVEHSEASAAGRAPDAKKISAAMATIAIVLDQLEDWCSESGFLLGDSLTLADCHAVPMFLYFVRVPEAATMLSGFPKLEHWMTRMAARSSVQKSRYEGA